MMRLCLVDDFFSLESLSLSRSALTSAHQCRESETLMSSSGPVREMPNLFASDTQAALWTKGAARKENRQK